MGNKLPNYKIHGRTYIVTGANSGIGFATSAILARMRAHVIMACRSETKGQAAIERLKRENPEASLELILLDLSDFESIQTFVATVTKRHPKLHCLINNAGVVTSKYSKSKYGLESMLTVNHLGPFLLTKLLRPHLEKLPESEGPPRVVYVSSDAHNFPKKFTQKQWQYDPSKEGETMGFMETLEFYGFTKLCNIFSTRYLAQILKEEKSPLRVFAIHPGWVETEIGKDEKGYMVRSIESVFARTPEAGAVPSIFCACDPELVADPKNNGGYYDGLNSKPSLKEHATDMNDAKLMWELTENVIAQFLNVGEEKEDNPK